MQAAEASLLEMREAESREKEAELQRPGNSKTKNFRDLSCFIQLFVWICDCFVVDFWFV